jgi:hypothetical protein
MSEPSVFPVATAHAAESGARLKARWYVSSDGARQWAFNWFDSALNTECSFVPGSDGVRRCIPTSAGVVVYYLDANCSQRIFATLASSCTAPKYMGEIVTADCESRYRLSEPGALIQPTDIYSKSGETCVVSAVSASFVYRRVGDEVPPSSFAEVQLVIDP